MHFHTTSERFLHFLKMDLCIALWWENIAEFRMNVYIINDSQTMNFSFHDIF